MENILITSENYHKLVLQEKLKVQQINHIKPFYILLYC